MLLLCWLVLVLLLLLLLCWLVLVLLLLLVGVELLVVGLVWTALLVLTGVIPQCHAACMWLGQQGQLSGWGPQYASGCQHLCCGTRQHLQSVKRALHAAKPHRNI